MKRFMFDAVVASIAVGGLSYELFKLFENIIEGQYSFVIYFTVMALIQAIFSGYFWGRTDADIKRLTT